MAPNSAVRRRATSIAAAALLVLIGLTVIGAPTAQGAATGIVTGVVRAPSGAVLDDAWIGLWAVDDLGFDYYEADVYSNASGVYTFPSVPPGEYYVYLFGPDDDPGVYWPNDGSEHTAGVVTVTAGETSTANIKLSKGARIIGMTLSPSGDPLRGTDVQMYFKYGDCATCWEYWGDSTGTYGSDRYVAFRLFPGTYKIEYTRPGYIPTFYPGSRTFANAKTVTVKAGETRTGVHGLLRKGIFVLLSKASVSGTPRVGRTLTATPPTTRPRAAIRYQWLRDRRAIRGATENTYRLRSADRGSAIGVRVTLRRDAYVTVLRWAWASDRVR